MKTSTRRTVTTSCALAGARIGPRERLRRLASRARASVRARADPAGREGRGASSGRRDEHVEPGSAHAGVPTRAGARRSTFASAAPAADLAADDGAVRRRLRGRRTRGRAPPRWRGLRCRAA